MTKWFMALVCVSVAVSVGAAQRPAEISMNGIGPKVGDIAPDFEAPDQQGVPRRLSSLLGPKGAMLVFYRSADW
jgi:AhpC/TSA family